MKIFYIGDNRNRINWGCRATSKALLSLVEINNTIIGTINGKETAEHSFTRTIYPKGILPIRVRRFFFNRRNRKIFKILYNIATINREKDDFIEENIDNSVNNFLKIKQVNPHLEDIYKKIISCDAIVINGEGSFILTTPYRRDCHFYLSILKLGQKLGKKTYLLNAMFSDCPKSGCNKETLNSALEIFQDCTLISTRDKTSYNYLKSFNKKINLQFIPDALFSWYDYFKDGVVPPQIGDYVIPFPEEDKYFGKFDFKIPYIVISGSSSAAWEQKKAVTPYVKLVEEIKTLGLQIYIIPTCSGDNFLFEVAEKTNIPILPPNTPIVMGASILANAKLMISGRFHPSILASLGGTPCIFLGSNSHKTLSLQELLEYEEFIEYKAIPSDNEIIKIKKEAIKKLKKGEELRKKIRDTVSRRAEEAKKISELI